MSRRFFTPSMGVACVALAVALSGTAYAVTRLPANSVGTKQVINHSLQGVDFKRGTLLRGPAGPRGPAALPSSSVSFRSKGAAISPTAGTDTTVIISCPEGTQVLYGGFNAWVPVFVMTNYGGGADWNVKLRSTGVAGPAYVYTACVKTS
jgi:hypothetical protein